MAPLVRSFPDTSDQPRASSGAVSSSSSSFSDKTRSSSGAVSAFPSGFGSGEKLATFGGVGYGGGTQAPSTAASSTTQSDAIKPLYGRDATGRRELGGSSASTTSSGMLEGKSLTSETRTQTNSTSQFGNMQAGVAEKKEEYRVPVSSSNSVLGQVFGTPPVRTSDPSGDAPSSKTTSEYKSPTALPSSSSAPPLPSSSTLTPRVSLALPTPASPSSSSSTSEPKSQLLAPVTTNTSPSSSSSPPSSPLSMEGERRESLKDAIAPSSSSPSSPPSSMGAERKSATAQR